MIRLITNQNVVNKVFKYPEAKQIIVSGDIHGDFKGIVYKLCVQYGYTDTLLIIAGDCGFGFEKPGYYETIYNQVAGRLRKANNWILFIRGNHDDPSYFSEEKVVYKRWRCVPDYSIIQACAHNILCVGGATSIDRLQRQEENARRKEKGHLQTAVWWPNEQSVFDEDAFVFIPVEMQIDTVVSHTAPSFCELYSHRGLQSWAVMDSKLISDVDKERNIMDRVFKRLKEDDHPIERWYYGHFHQSWSGQREGVLFSMLDIEEFKEIPTNTDADNSLEDIDTKLLSMAKTIPAPSPDELEADPRLKEAFGK